MRQFHRTSIALLRYAVPRWRGWITIILLTLASSLITVAQPWPMKLLVDHVLSHGTASSWLAKNVARLPLARTPHGFIACVAFARLVFFLLNSAVDIMQNFVWLRVGQGMVYDLSKDLFARLQRRSL